MPRTPDGRLRAPTDADIALTDALAVRLGSLEAAVTALNVVTIAGWTPPPPGWIPPARPDMAGQGDLLAAARPTDTTEPTP